MDEELASRLGWGVRKREKIRRARAGNAFSSLSDLWLEAMRARENNQSCPEPARPRQTTPTPIAAIPDRRPIIPNLPGPRRPQHREGEPYLLRSLGPPCPALPQ